MKSEPDVFGIDHLRNEKSAEWDGVRNYQSRNHLRAMKKGDLAFFYHSSAKPSGIAGLLRIVREAHPDPTQFDPRSDYFDAGSTLAKPRWDQVKVEFVEKFRALLSLDEIRNIPALNRMILLTRGRLSVQPVTPEQWHVLLDRLRR